MGQTTTLFGARIRALSNSRASGTGALGARAIVVVLALVIALVIAGELASASMLAAPTETATPALGRRVPVPGDAALEAAFWLSCLLSAFFSFRVMESLFRSPHVRALELLPVRPGPIFAERVGNAMLEASLLGFLATAFFLPLAWNAEPVLTLLCAGIAFGAAVCTASCTIGVNAWFGAQWGGASGLGDGYGGQGGAFIYAPMVALTTSVGCVFMLQLGARELLHDGRLTNAALLGAGIAFAVSGSALAVGGRHFVASYHRVAAFFREADDIGYRAVMDYQQSSWVPVRGELLAGATGAAVFRRHATQFNRLFAVGRSLAMIGSVGAAIGTAVFSPAAYPTWLAGLLPAAVLVLLERPYTRIDDERLGGLNDPLLPLSPAVLHRAVVAWWVWETLRVAVPFAVIAGVLRTFTVSLEDGLWVAGLGFGAALATTGVSGLVRRSATSTAVRTVGGILPLICLGALAAYDLALGAIAATALGSITVKASLSGGSK